MSTNISFCTMKKFAYRINLAIHLKVEAVH